ncbi:sensor histidine kinase [Shouchella rhizosphaerae]|uniref:sensor histidine kinase n=1 Tax=Shouchella rhizosphaerae TaxID=866786 RepID=UPI00203B75E7|nr:sensor histidine kinase [Shouchella rhizosphaerae]
MAYWVRVAFIFAGIVIWPLSDKTQLVEPLFWLTSGLILGGLLSEPLWRRPMWLYSLLTAIACVYILLAGMDAAWLVPILLAVYPFARTSSGQWQAGALPSALVAASILCSPTGIAATFVWLLTTVILFYMMWQFALWQRQNRQQQEKIDELQYEQKQLRRRFLEHEDAAKQRERTRIARDVHDSVGHQLTALMMQLQVAEMKVQDPVIAEAKQTARTALAEMRSAVRALESEEERGVAMIIRLIRKLEAEGHVRVTFTTEAGALSVPLSEEQNVALYRFVQEGLTNAMRHSYAKEIDVHLAVVGKRTYVATLKNEAEPEAVREGFGLTQLRNRFEQLHGWFRASNEDGMFIVEGAFPIERTTAIENDSFS